MLKMNEKYYLVLLVFIIFLLGFVVIFYLNNELKKYIIFMDNYNYYMIVYFLKWEDIEFI